jgi:hypothetical protein
LDEKRSFRFAWKSAPNRRPGFTLRNSRETEGDRDRRRVMRISSAIGTWRLRLALLASVCAVGSLSAGGTAMANHSIDLNFNTDEENFFPGPAPSNAYAFGHVESGPTVCRRGRTFDLYKNTGPSKILIDSGRSSDNGFFALGGDLSGATSVLIKMKTKRFGPRGDRHTCESDTNTFFL